MAKPTYKKPEPKPTHGVPARAEWGRTHATVLAGQAHIDGLDHVAIEMERKWGADRLRLLVSAELREKFDRQRFLVNNAIWSGTLEDVRVSCERMIKAWHALDRSATISGQPVLNPAVWEIALEGGETLALARSDADANHVAREGRAVIIWSLEEVARLISARVFEQKVKREFPGASITSVRQTISDPLRRMNSGSLLDDEIPF
jgi:hypothetical protein